MNVAIILPLDVMHHFQSMRYTMFAAYLQKSYQFFSLPKARTTMGRYCQLLCCIALLYVSPQYCTDAYKFGYLYLLVVVITGTTHFENLRQYSQLENMVGKKMSTFLHGQASSSSYRRLKTLPCDRHFTSGKQGAYITDETLLFLRASVIHVDPNSSK